MRALRSCAVSGGLCEHVWSCLGPCGINGRKQESRPCLPHVPKRTLLRISVLLRGVLSLGPEVARPQARMIRWRRRPYASVSRARRVAPARALAASLRDAAKNHSERTPAFGRRETARVTASVRDLDYELLRRATSEVNFSVATRPSRRKVTRATSETAQRRDGHETHAKGLAGWGDKGAYSQGVVKPGRRACFMKPLVQPRVTKSLGMWARSSKHEHHDDAHRKMPLMAQIMSCRGFGPHAL